MSFTLTKNQFGTTTTPGTNVMIDYIKIAEAFCLEYYTLYDDNIGKLAKLYHTDAKFVYFDYEFTGFNEWSNAVKHNYFYKFSHTDMNINVVPISDANLLVNISGGIQINNSNITKFTETILLQKDGFNNCGASNFCVCATMFRLV